MPYGEMQRRSFGELGSEQWSDYECPKCGLKVLGKAWGPDYAPSPEQQFREIIVHILEHLVTGA